MVPPQGRWHGDRTGSPGPARTCARESRYRAQRRRAGPCACGYLASSHRNGVAMESVTAVATVRERTGLVSQVVTLIAVVVPPLALFSAMGVLWGVGFHLRDLGLLATMYVVCAFGTTIGFHRYFT